MFSGGSNLLGCPGGACAPDAELNLREVPNVGKWVRDDCAAITHCVFINSVLQLLGIVF